MLPPYQPPGIFGAFSHSEFQDGKSNSLSEELKDYYRSQ